MNSEGEFKMEMENLILNHKLQRIKKLCEYAISSTEKDNCFLIPMLKGYINDIYENLEDI